MLRTDHVEPFQRAAPTPGLEMPTATQDVGEAHDSTGSRTSNPFACSSSRIPDQVDPDIVANWSLEVTMHQVALVHDTEGCSQSELTSRWFVTVVPLIR